MTSRTRLWVLVVSTPVIAFALIGGYARALAAARDETYQHLRVFQDVVSLVVDNYVEEVDVKEAMRGAMRGLADGLDPDSAFLTPESGEELREQRPDGRGRHRARHFPTVTICASCRCGPAPPPPRPASGTGDYIRAIDNRPTREMTAYEGLRLLHGAENSNVKLLVIRGNAADPHEVTLTRERPTALDVTTTDGRRQHRLHPHRRLPCGLRHRVCGRRPRRWPSRAPPTT